MLGLPFLYRELGVKSLRAVAQLALTLDLSKVGWDQMIF